MQRVFYFEAQDKRRFNKINLEYDCNKDRSEEERYFLKVEINGRYKYGIKQLENRIQAALDKNYFSQGYRLQDSVYFFSAIIDRKDSCLNKVELNEGYPSLFTQVVTDELKTSCAWEPALQGGRGGKNL
jgi:hypothetical protein